MKRFMRRFHRGQKGFTLMELLIVVAVLGILAAVIVPNLATFLSTGQAAAANTEVANVESAALAYYADNNAYPSDTNTDLLGGGYISAAAEVDYGFDAFGKVSIADATAWPNDASVTWDLANHKWTK
jgi:type IV pilus assembly protein PilA